MKLQKIHLASHACDHPLPIGTLDDWVREWHQSAIAARFIVPSYDADEATILLLKDYYYCGLLPAEAVFAMFAQKH
ncbi:MAG: hypothetical protein RXR20_21935 [Paraburkholderia sp.]|jgi:hypothetical protein|uniref:hypothetical protein n=1 Tax=Burkholderiaceae TaxID=119060 RepID=UPI0010F6DBEA|nr:hypothetical protein [Burkholderia sp. 4M9327F10]